MTKWGVGEDGKDFRVGKPFGTLFLEPGQVQEAVDGWMESHKKGGEREGKTPTVSSLAFALNITRRTLLDYQARDAFKSILDRAKGFVEMGIDDSLFDPKIRPAGPIFNLKENFGWKDGSQVDLNVNVGWSAVLKKAKELREGEEPIDV